MNTHAQSNGATRVLVLVATLGALAFSACGSDGADAEVSPAKDSGYWDGSLYPRPQEPEVPAVGQPQDDESVRAPRLMGGDPVGPTV